MVEVGELMVVVELVGVVDVVQQVVLGGCKSCGAGKCVGGCGGG